MQENYVACLWFYVTAGDECNLSIVRKFPDIIAVGLPTTCVIPKNTQNTFTVKLKSLCSNRPPQYCVSVQCLS